MNNLKYFEGKVCTIITVPTNRNFKEEAEAVGKPELYLMNVMSHFMGRVLFIDSSSVIIQHPIIGTHSYFRLNNIIGIMEEQELDPNDPEQAKIVAQYNEKRGVPTIRGKTLCPNGHSLNIPANIQDGSEVICPTCKIEFILNPPKSLPESKSEFVDIDLLSQIANSCG